MNNLSIIIVICAGLSIPASIWAIVYFLARIIIHRRIRSELGDMPTREEIAKLYEQNNVTIIWRDTPPL